MIFEPIQNFLQELFAFNDKSPLLFTQFHFWVFFAIVFAGLTFMKNKVLLRNAFLLFVSFFFYYKTSGLFVLLLATTTLTCYFCGGAISKSATQFSRKLFLWLGVGINLFLLFYFKYAYFLTDLHNQIFQSEYQVVNYFAQWGNRFLQADRFSVDSIILPVGISFYTFQSISYVVDVYRRKMEHIPNLMNFGFFVSFFPGLVAGPIIRAHQFLPQVYKKYHLSRRQFGVAIFWILNGLVKKIVLSDYIAVNFVDRVFDNPGLFTGFENLSAIFFYSLQVYADFSGYTDIALGVAMLMGFYLPLNFNSPYKATNAGDFWRRWHISLSTWLKDYLYIPLGGSRKGKWRTNFNLMITMLLGGLWHGASWNFVIWGGLNGMGIVIFKFWRNMSIAYKTLLTFLVYLTALLFHLYYGFPVFQMALVWSALIFFGTLFQWIYELIFKKRPITWLYRGWSILLTFIFITFTRLFFRSGSNLSPADANEMAWNTAKNMVTQIGGKWNFAQIPEIFSSYWFIFVLFFIGMIIHWLPENWKRWYRLNFAIFPIWLIGIITVATVFFVYQFVTADLQPFIYFQF